MPVATSEILGKSLDPKGHVEEGAGGATFATARSTSKAL